MGTPILVTAGVQPSELKSKILSTNEIYETFEHPSSAKKLIYEFWVGLSFLSSRPFHYIHTLHLLNRGTAACAACIALLLSRSLGVRQGQGDGHFKTMWGLSGCNLILFYTPVRMLLHFCSRKLWSTDTCNVRGYYSHQYHFVLNYYVNMMYCS